MSLWDKFKNVVGFGGDEGGTNSNDDLVVYVDSTPSAGSHEQAATDADESQSLEGYYTVQVQQVEQPDATKAAEGNIVETVTQDLGREQVVEVCGDDSEPTFEVCDAGPAKSDEYNRQLQALLGSDSSKDGFDQHIIGGANVEGVNDLISQFKAPESAGNAEQAKQSREQLQAALHSAAAKVDVEAAKAKAARLAKISHEGSESNDEFEAEDQEVNKLLADAVHMTETLADKIPSSPEAIKKYQEKAEELMEYSWGKAIGGAMLVVAGIALALVSATLACASFGVIAPFSFAGVTFGATLVSGGAAALFGAAGIGAIVGGGSLISTAKSKKAVVEELDELTTRTTEALKKALDTSEDEKSIIENVDSEESSAIASAAA